MIRLLVFPLFTSIAISVSSQVTLSLDSCRALAMSNNKELLISNEKINSAYNERKAAFTNYLPHISATGTYMRNQKEISILNNDQKGALNNMGTTINAGFQEFAHAAGAMYPDFAHLISSLGNSMVDPLNGIGNSIVDAFRTDTRNLFAGAVTLTQPVFMGGKIRAYNKITRYAEELARQQHHTGLQDVILNTDQVYWTVVSLVNKKKLAESYLKFLQQMDSDVDKMIAEGVATKAEGLSVKVKLNEAEMNLVKVEDGVNLAKMLLCQLCGLSLTTPIHLADENIENISIASVSTLFDMNNVYARRPEIRSLELGWEIYNQKINVTRAEYLPSVALMGNYIMTNPGFTNGFEKKFRGMWNVGLMVQIPIWHWREGTYKLRAARAEARIAEYRLSDAREKIELQVNQSAFKVNEARKKLNMANRNMEKANENLRYANLGFKEGVIPALHVMEAQTAWLSAHSERIDAQIDVKLTEIYLRKSMGSLLIDN